MKIFIYTKNSFPNGMAPTNRIKCYARAFRESGLDCEVVICGSTELIKGKVRNTEAKGYYEGVPFKYIGGSTTDTRWKRIRLLSQWVKLKMSEFYLYRNIQKGDVLFLFMHGNVYRKLQFMKIAHRKGAFCVSDLCELPYGTGEETETAIRLRKITMEQQFPKLDGIISISGALLNLARKYTNPACKHIKVPIMVDYDKYYMQNKSDDVEVPYIFHSGTLSQQKDGIIGMIEAFALASKRLNKNVKFISTGKIDNANNYEKREVMRLIKTYGLEDNVVFMGYLSDDELKEYLSKASLVIINKYRTQQNNYCFSTKLGEYMAAAKPVIITKVGEAINWLEDGKSAYIIEPENIEALANSIVDVFENLDKAKKIGQYGQEVCHQHFDYKVWSQPLSDFMKSISAK